MAALMNESSPACRPASRSCFRSSSDNRLLSMLGILGILDNTIAIPPMLSVAIAVANETPEMSAATPSGFCAPQPFPIQNAPIEYPTNERKNREQKTPPVNLMLSLKALPMVPAMARIRQILVLTPSLTDLLPVDKYDYDTQRRKSGTRALLESLCLILMRCSEPLTDLLPIAKFSIKSQCENVKRNLVEYF